MPGEARTLQIGGQQVQAETTVIVGSDEHFNTYTLDDGTTVKVKAVLMSLYKIPGQTNPDGTPVYLAFVNPTAGQA